MVVNAHVDPSQPVAGVRVSLSFVTGAEKVVDARDATNRAGQALLLVSQEAAQRGDLRIEIGGVSDLVVYEPADGQLTGNLDIPSLTVHVKLLPKKDPALMGPAQIYAMLHRLLLQSEQLKQQNRTLKGELAAAQGQKPEDLTAAMTEWAKANGFAIKDVDAKVQEWAEEVLQDKKQDYEDQQALAQLALKHYGVAAPMFHQAATDQLSAFKERQLKEHAEEVKELQQYLDSEYQSARAFQMDSQYHQATQILEKARDEAAEQRRMSPEDPGYRTIWRESLWMAAQAREREAENATARDRIPLLSRSIDDFRKLLTEFASPDEQTAWAKTQHALGGALEEQASWSRGVQAAELSAQAVAADRAALTVLTEANQPIDWAWTQTELGYALEDQAERGSGAQAADLSAQEIAAQRAALEAFTKAGSPADSAIAQLNLGRALVHQANLNLQAERGTGAELMDLFAQAAQAYAAALKVFTKADTPHDWANTQESLGNLFEAEGRLHGCDREAVDFFSHEVAAERAALEVYTKADLPQAWAGAQMNLGNALENQGRCSRRLGPDDAMDPLAQAAQAYRAAQEVYTKADFPEDWADAQQSLGNLLDDLAERTSGAQAAAFFAQAVQAYRAELEVRTKSAFPEDWADTQHSLGNALDDQGEQSSGAQAAAFFAQAVQAFRADLEVRTKSAFPEDWADAQDSLGNALDDQAGVSSGKQAAALLAQEVQAFRAELEVRTKSAFPKDWAYAQDHLKDALIDEGDYSGAASVLEASLQADPNDFGVLTGLIDIYQNKLYRYEHAYELTKRLFKLPSTPGVRLNMVEIDLEMEERDLTTSRFDDCEKQALSIDDAASPAPATSVILIRDTLKLTCQWGAGQKAAARATGAALVQKAAGLESSTSDFAGARHFLGSSRAFARGRASWIALFQSLEDGNGAAMTGALDQLEEVMKK